MSITVHESALPGLIREALEDADPEDLAVAYMALTGRIPDIVADAAGTSTTFSPVARSPSTTNRRPTPAKEFAHVRRHHPNR